MSHRTPCTTLDPPETGAMTIWEAGSQLYGFFSPLNDLLESGNFTLEQLLQEDELIQEVKTRNDRLLEFLSQESIILKLVEYVVTPSPDPSDDLRTLKYPYVSCEVICCDIFSITSTLAMGNYGSIMLSFMEFLNQPAPLDPRLCGYFGKILSMLMVRKPQEVTSMVNRNANTILQGFMIHIQSYSIAEQFKRMLQPFYMDLVDDPLDYPGLSIDTSPSLPWYAGLDEDEGSASTPTASKTLVWHRDTAVIDLLIENFQPVESLDSSILAARHKHTADVLIDLIHYGARSQQNEPSSPSSETVNPISTVLVQYLETREVIEKIVKHAIPNCENRSDSAVSSMTTALSVLCALVSLHTNARYTNMDMLHPVLETVLARLPQICDILVHDRFGSGSFYNQRHLQVERLGIRRLRLIGLLVLLSQTKTDRIDAAILEQNAVEICLDLFFCFESVNMLHAQVENMVVGILMGGSKNLLIALIRNGRLLSRLIEAYKLSEQVLEQPKPFVFGYMGHVHRICQVIISLLHQIRDESAGTASLVDMAHADTVADLLEENKQVSEEWNFLVTHTLTPLYEENQHPLGGIPSEQEHDTPLTRSFDNAHNDIYRNTLGLNSVINSSWDDDPGFNVSILAEIMNDSSSDEDDFDIPLEQHASNDSEAESHLIADNTQEKE